MDFDALLPTRAHRVIAVALGVKGLMLLWFGLFNQFYQLKSYRHNDSCRRNVSQSLKLSNVSLHNEFAVNFCEGGNTETYFFLLNKKTVQDALKLH